MKRRSGFTLIELLLVAGLSSVVVLGLVTGLVLFSGRAAQERNQRQLQSEVELTERAITGEIESSVDLPPVADFGELDTLPGPIALALVLPKGEQYVLVLYCFGGLPEGFPYDEPNFQQRYGAIQGALYRWESPPFADPVTPPELYPEDIDPAQLQLVSAYLQPYNEQDPNQSGLVFVPAEDGRGGLLAVIGLRPLDFKGEGTDCTNSNAPDCRPFIREVYVYSKNIAAADLPVPTMDEADLDPG
ncbi:type II secretion system protein [Candidatus Cyanaurora vandensis]|uniref:type II secretion system protein n=1 Tax=Candidatus Cyanaurora vandensis TaxID=2714958 RepID=UPI002579D008|nr:type II secretion system protein [Candidatus Cyanaurora vandensis]